MPPRKQNTDEADLQEKKKGLSKLNSDRKHIEHGRKLAEDKHNEFFADRRGGIFHVIDGQRIHEKDLTDSQREALSKPKKEE